MDSDNLFKKARKTLQAATVLGSVLTGTPPTMAQSPNTPKIETPDDISGFFDVDEFAPLDEKDRNKTREELTRERQELLGQLVARLKTPDPNDSNKAILKSDRSLELLVPLNLASGRSTIRIILFPAPEIRLVLFRNANTIVTVIIDSGVTGTPSRYQLRVTDRGAPWPFPFDTEGTNPLAERIYLGLLRQLQAAM